MSNYTTGELAKLCGVSVRTVQYYDARNILLPTALSEGGRRIYSEDDLKKLRIICFLRELGFSLDHIRELFAESEPEKVIELLLAQQQSALQSELTALQTKLDTLTEIQRAMKYTESFTLQSLGDIAHIMKHQKKRRQMLAWMITVGLVADAIQVAAIVYGILRGHWWPLFPAYAVVIALCVWISRYYFDHSQYICPSCHEIFKPTLRVALFAYHTPRTRKLTCPHCGHNGFCVEIYAEVEK